LAAPRAAVVDLKEGWIALRVNARVTVAIDVGDSLVICEEVCSVETKLRRDTGNSNQGFKGMTEGKIEQVDGRLKKSSEEREADWVSAEICSYFGRVVVVRRLYPCSSIGHCGFPARPGI